MSEEIPQITICEGCHKAPVLRRVNAENKAFLGLGVAVKREIAKLETQIAQGGEAGDIAKRTRDELFGDSASGLMKVAREIEVVQGVNAVVCQPDAFCARELAYRHSGGSAPVQDPPYQNPGQ